MALICLNGSGITISNWFSVNFLILPIQKLMMYIKSELSLHLLARSPNRVRLTCMIFDCEMFLLKLFGFVLKLKPPLLGTFVFFPSVFTHLFTIRLDSDFMPSPGFSFMGVGSHSSYMEVTDFLEV